jgi:hypothetical protein
MLLVGGHCVEAEDDVVLCAASVGYLELDEPGAVAADGHGNAVVVLNCELMGTQLVFLLAGAFEETASLYR